MPEIFDGVLFAAGRGERLRPLTDICPKPGLPILDIPLAAWGLAALAAASQRLVVNTSHLSDVAARLLGPFSDAEIFEEPVEPFGTAGTLRELGPRLGPEIAIWNGDLLANIDMAEVRRRHRAAGRPATLVVKMVSSGGDMTVDGDRATGFIDRRVHGDAPGALFVGAGVLRTDALDIIPSTGPQGLGGAVIAPLIESGDVTVVIHEGYTLDVGTPARYLAGSLDVLEGVAPMTPTRPPGRTIEVSGGHAYIGPGVHYSEVQIGPGAILLEGARLGDDAYVERSVVWPGTPVRGIVRDSLWFDRDLDLRDER